VRTGPGDELAAAAGRRFSALRDAHDRHAAALRGPDPLARLAGPVPARDPEAAEQVARLGLRRSIARLVERERALAARHREAAVAASGSVALLWGSLAVAAGTYAAALAGNGPPVARPQPPASLPVLSDVAATQALVGQLHALVYGYQLALGRLPVGSRAAARGQRGLGDARALRDRFSAWLTRHSAAVPAAEPAYAPTVPVRGAASAAELLERLEVALLPFCGLTLAAATTAGDRTQALQVLEGTAARAGGWSAPPQVWPGWTA